MAVDQYRPSKGTIFVMIVHCWFAQNYTYLGVGCDCSDRIEEVWRVEFGISGLVSGRCCYWKIALLVLIYWFVMSWRASVRRYLEHLGVIVRGGNEGPKRGITCSNKNCIMIEEYTPLRLRLRYWSMRTCIGVLCRAEWRSPEWTKNAQDIARMTIGRMGRIVIEVAKAFNLK